MAFKGQKRLKKSSWELFPWASSHAVKPKQASDNNLARRRGLHVRYVFAVVITRQLQVQHMKIPSSNLGRTSLCKVIPFPPPSCCPRIYWMIPSWVGTGIIKRDLLQLSLKWRHSADLCYHLLWRTFLITKAFTMTDKAFMVLPSFIWSGLHSIGHIA